VTKSLAELARFVGGRVVGDGQIDIIKVAAIDEAGPGDITFLANPRYQPLLAECQASAVIVGSAIIEGGIARAAKNFLVTATPYLAFAQILQLYTPACEFNRQVSVLAYVESSARLADDVTIFPHAYIGKDARVGNRSVLYPGVYLGERSAVGDDCVLYPNVVVREGCRVGDRVILHPGVVIGSDGFGYAGHGEARVKIPQIGIVVIEDDVEVGANTTIDRATLGRTVVGHGAKIDNLVQIAHNVNVGEFSVIAAQVGIAGSTRIGRNVTLAGQAGIAHHREIGDGAVIGPKTGVARSVPPGAVLSGWIEAAPHRQWIKAMMLLPKLPALWSNVKSLEKKLELLLTKGSGES